MQVFLSKPKFDKKFIYSSPTTLYQEFANAYAYNKMSITCNPRPNKQAMVNEINAEWKKIKSEKTEDLIKEYIKTLHDEAVPTITCSFSQSNQSNINSIVDSELEYLLDQTLVSHETPLAFNSNFIEDFDFLPSTSTRFFNSLNSRDAFSDFE